MNDILGVFTDVTVAAAMTTASHFGLAIETVDTRTPAAAQRTVRRTTVSSSTGKPTPRSVRSLAR